MGLEHEHLCQRALRWLSGTRRCNPVFCRIASCAEIPDAIGWSSSYKHHGSTVVECKTSVSDFYADLKKRLRWQHPDYKDWFYRGRRMSAKEASLKGYIQHSVPLMGNFRFYLCRRGVLAVAMVEDKAPDHGLLYMDGRRIIMAREAPLRETADYPSEVRYLRFAIINRKSNEVERVA